MAPGAIVSHELTDLGRQRLAQAGIDLSRLETEDWKKLLEEAGNTLYHRAVEKRRMAFEEYLREHPVLKGATAINTLRKGNEVMKNKCRVTITDLNYEDHLVYVTDLDPDGKPSGPSYLIMCNNLENIQPPL